MSDSSSQNGAASELVARLRKATSPELNAVNFSISMQAYLVSMLGACDERPRQPQLEEALRAVLVVLSTWRAARIKHLLAEWEKQFLLEFPLSQSPASPSPGVASEDGEGSERQKNPGSFDGARISRASLRIVDFYRRRGDPNASPLSCPIVWKIIDRVFTVDASIAVSLSLYASACSIILSNRMAIVPASIFGFRLPAACSNVGESVKSSHRREIALQFRACVFVDLENQTRRKSSLGWAEAATSRDAIVKIKDNDERGWRVAVGDAAAGSRGGGLFWTFRNLKRLPQFRGLRTFVTG